ncbi:MAG TPA: cellulase family glycosylhydrolase [Gaiellaceae bacterium]
MRLLFALLSAAALLAPAAASAASRMPIGFQDDPTFRWSDTASAEVAKAAAAHASVIRTIADWRALAPQRPARPTDSFDPAYRLNDLDALVRNAQRDGLQVMITIWGTPSWANGGRGPNAAPRRLSDLTDFAHALADRYSGRHAGYPYVGRWSVWNEPNLGIFLSPQFGAHGAIVAPRIYAGLYRAAWAGIKAGNRAALVAIGETSNQGRDHPKRGINDSTAPGTFARLLAQQPGLRFDAYATHPYPTRPNLPPSQQVRWPNVTLTQLPRFESSIDAWFHRRAIPIWITEYGYETRPGEPAGVSTAQQARYLTQVVHRLQADPRVQMFVWFIFRDSPTSLWQSGLFGETGQRKPADATVAAVARAVAGQTRTIRPQVMPRIRVALPRIAYTSPPGAVVGVHYRVYLGGKLVVTAEPSAKLQRTQTIVVRALFHPLPRRVYTLKLTAADRHGSTQVATYRLVTA